MTEGQQGFEGRESAVPAGGRESVERIGEVLQVGESDCAKGFSLRGSKPLDIRPVSSLGMRGAAMQPDFEELVNRTRCGARPGGRRKIWKRPFQITSRKRN